MADADVDALRLKSLSKNLRLATSVGLSRGGQSLDLARDTEWPIFTLFILKLQVWASWSPLATLRYRVYRISAASVAEEAGSVANESEHERKAWTSSL